MAPRSRLLGIAFIGITAMAGIAAAILLRHGHPPVALTAGTFVSPSRALPDFTLIDAHARAFGSANLRGRWSLLFFGYTNCPDVCPGTLTLLAAAEERLRKQAAPVRPQVIFVSVDAKRDTPQQLANYVPYFDPEFIGITGADQDAVASVAAKLGVAVLITPQADGSYTVDHSTEILVVNPDGRLAAILSGPLTVDVLVTDFERIIAAAT